MGLGRQNALRGESGFRANNDSFIRAWVGGGRGASETFRRGAEHHQHIIPCATGLVYGTAIRPSGRWRGRQARFSPGALPIIGVSGKAYSSPPTVQG